VCFHGIALRHVNLAAPGAEPNSHAL